MKRPTKKKTASRAKLPKTGRRTVKRQRARQQMAVAVGSPALAASIQSILETLFGARPLPFSFPPRDDAGKTPAPVVRLTKVDEQFTVETRDYSCGCGDPTCAARAQFVTLVLKGEAPVAPPLKSATVEAVDIAHMRAAKEIRDMTANRRAQAEDVLSHALGNCPCHGVKSPSA